MDHEDNVVGQPKITVVLAYAAYIGDVEGRYIPDAFRFNKYAPENSLGRFLPGFEIMVTANRTLGTSQRAAMENFW